MCVTRLQDNIIIIRTIHHNDVYLSNGIHSLRGHHIIDIVRVAVRVKY